MSSTFVQTSPEDDSGGYEKFSETCLKVLHEIRDRLPEPRLPERPLWYKVHKKFLSEDILKERGISYETNLEVSIYGRNDPNLYLLGKKHDAYLGICKRTRDFLP